MLSKQTERLRLGIALLLIFAAAVFFLESFWCGLQTSKWVGLVWTDSMKATAVRGRFTNFIFFALQIPIALLIPAFGRLAEWNLATQSLFASAAEPSRIIRWSLLSYVIRLGIAICSTIGLSIFLYLSFSRTVIYLWLQDRFEALLNGVLL